MTQERPGGLEQPHPESLQSLFHQRGFPELNPGKEEKRVPLGLTLHCRDPGMVIPDRQGLLGWRWREGICEEEKSKVPWPVHGVGFRCSWAFAQRPTSLK